MEAADGRRRGGGKPSEQGRKQDGALTAEDEARRREAVREMLREKLELERRALKVVERLLEDSVAEDFLIDCVRFITPANYRDAVDERSLAKLCGYPTCPNTLGQIPAQKYKISTKTNKVFDITERKCFCSNFCYKASKQLELQIPRTPLWLRQSEMPPAVTLMKTGHGGSSGEEVMLSERRLEDVEETLAAPPEGPPSCQREQDFISSLVSQQGGPRVRWGDPPKRADEDERREVERRKVGMRKQEEDETEKPGEDVECKTGSEEERLSSNADQTGEEGSPAGAGPSPLSVPETVAAPQAAPRAPPPLASSSQRRDSADLSGLAVTQVGVSRRGAAGLQVLFQNCLSGGEPDSFRLALLRGLQRTLKDWRTNATMTFLYGPGPPPGPPPSDALGEEELDEDDLHEEAKGASEELRKEVQQLQLRVQDFYKGTWTLPEDVQEQPEKELKVQDQNPKDPLLPLLDSQAQRLIQKRIAVERLVSCLRNVVTPLRLTMTDIITDLNNLVRTFSFTSKNIIHRTPEWILISVVLLHLLSQVSPAVRDALQTAASVEYLNTLMKGVGLQEDDLLTLIRVFKPPTHTHTQPDMD